MTSHFSMDKTSGTEYDTHLLCAMIADHVTLLAIFLLYFWAAESSLEGVKFAKFNLCQFMLRRLNPCQFKRIFYWHCENGINVGIVLLATNGLSLSRTRGQLSKFAMSCISISGSLTEG